MRLLDVIYNQIMIYLFNVSPHQDCQMVSSTVQPRLLAILSEQLYYDEIAIPFTRMQNECKQLIALLSEAHIDIQDRLNCSVFTIDQANELVCSPTHIETHDHAFIFFCRE